MPHLSASCRYFLFQGHADMRKGFDSLSGIVTNQMNSNALSGDIYVFLNRRKNHIKLLLWEGDGFALYHKRLERGTYELPATSALTHQQLSLLLQGVILKSVKHHKRYQHQLKISG
ncbi:IS66 family insertion sequence element accessory protein TnpB [Filimonas effusa]|nr:IS66 family insertion sequence element accessory protein TnpB [Filimonas effusa]